MSNFGWFMLILGLVLLVLELLIPSFGVVGLAGFFLIVIAAVTEASTLKVGILSGILVFVVASIALLLLYLLFRSRLSRNGLFLRSDQRNEEGYIPQEDRTDLLNRVGATVTPLRPSGYALFGERREDVVSEGNGIGTGVLVKVIHVEGSRVVVRPVEDDNPSD